MTNVRSTCTPYRYAGFGTAHLSYWVIVFKSLTDPVDVFDEKKINVVQEFTALMYGVKNCESVNVAKHNLFLKMYVATKSDGNFVRKIKGLNSCQIPPCWRSLKQKLLITIFVNSMWRNATETCCVKLCPEDCGWFFDDYLKPTWFIGDPTPLQVEDILKVSQNDDSDNANNLESDAQSSSDEADDD